MAVEFHDAMYNDQADLYDEVSGTKMKGYVDHDKVDEWKNILGKTLKRRLDLMKEKDADEKYLNDNPAPRPLYDAKNVEIVFSKDSRELYDIMEEGNKLADRVEL